MAHLFISYRREDSADATGRLYDRLGRHFGTEAVFKDVDSILSGEDFRAAIVRAIERCQAVLVVIGPKWSPILDRDGKRRLENPADPVRLEIETGLRIGVPVVPVLVSRAEMPAPDTLPDSLVQLAFRNAASVRQDPDFHPDADRLIRDLDVLIAASKRLQAGGAFSIGGVRPNAPKSERTRRQWLVPGLVGLTLGLGLASGGAALFLRPKPATERAEQVQPPGTVRTATLVLHHTMETSDGPITAMAIRPSGDRMVVIGIEGEEADSRTVVSVWSLETGTLLAKADTSGTGEDAPTHVTYRPDGSQFALLAGTQLTVFDAKTNARLRSVELDLDPPPTSIEYRADGRTLFCLSEKWATIVDVETGRRISRGAVGIEMVTDSLAMSTDRKWAVTTHLDGKARLWDLNSGKSQRRFEPPPRLLIPGMEPDPPAVENKEPEPGTESKDKPAAKDSKPEKAPEEPKKKPPPADWPALPKANAALLSRQGEVRFDADAAMAQRGGVLGAGLPMFGGLAGFAGFGGAGFGGGQLGLGGLGGGQLGVGGNFGGLGGAGIGGGAFGIGGNAGFIGGPPAISYGYATADREAKYLAAVQTNSDVHLRDLSSGRLLKSINVRGLDVLLDDLHTVTFATFSPDGKTLLTAGADRAIRFWDVETGHLFHIYEGQAEPIWSMKFTTDAQRLVTVGADGTTRVWEVKFGMKSE
jgi:WD40 repeat protein